MNTHSIVKGCKEIIRYYNSTVGNLYYRARGTADPFQICEGFDLNEIKSQWAYGEWELIYIEGPCLGTSVEVEI